MATKGSGVGVSITTWGVNGSGIVQGTNGALANGASSEMGELIGVENINLPLASMRAVPIPGDNSLIGGVPLPPNTISQGTLTLTVQDPVFATTPVGMLVNTEDGLDFSLLGPACPTFKSLTLIANAPGINTTSGSLGQPGYMVSVYPNVSIYPRGNDGAQDGTALNFMSDLMLSMFDRTPWGAQPTKLLYGATRGARLNPFFSVAPMNIATLTGDAAAVTLTLNNTPYSADGTSVRAYSTAAGVCTPLVYGAGAGKYTVDVATRVVTFGTAPAAGTIVTVFYKFVPGC